MPKSYPVPLTKEEMQRLIDASIEDDFFYMFFIVAKTTGRRLGEYFDVQRKDIDLETGIMNTRVLKRKQYIMKEAVLLPEALHLLKRYILKEGLKLDDYVFRKVGYRQIQNKVKTYAKKAGIEHNVSFHNFRHYFITELFKQGWDYSKIAKLTGHSTPNTLVNYDHAVASDFKAEALTDIAKI